MLKETSIFANDFTLILTLTTLTKMIFGIIFLLILCVIIAFVISIIKGEKESKAINEMVKTTDDINLIWNTNCPSSESVEKHGRSLYVKYETNDTAYKAWLKNIPNEYPLQYLNAKKVCKECYGDNMMGMPQKKLVGGLYIMSADGRFYGNFYFMESGFFFMYNKGGTEEPEKELKGLRCSLPHFQVLSISYHDSFTDYGYHSLIRFSQIIERDYYEKLKLAIKDIPRWEWQEDDNSICVAKKANAEIGSEDFLYLTFWIGEDGKQYGKLSWGKV